MTHTVNFVKNQILHHSLGMSQYEAFGGKKLNIGWLRTFGYKCWALIPKNIRRKGQYKSVKGIFVGYFNDSKAYKIWIPESHTILKVRDAIFDKSNHIEQVTIHATDDDDLLALWTNEPPISITPQCSPSPSLISEWTSDADLPMQPRPNTNKSEIGEDIKREGREHKGKGANQPDNKETTKDEEATQRNSPKDFEKGPWLDPDNQALTLPHGLR